MYPTPEAYEGLTAVTAHDALVKSGAMGQLLLWVSLAEVISSFAVVEMLQGSGRAPGYFGFDPMGMLKGASKEKKENMELKELTNGRLAMLAFSGMVSFESGSLVACKVGLQVRLIMNCLSCSTGHPSSSDPGSLPLRLSGMALFTTSNL